MGRGIQGGCAGEGVDENREEDRGGDCGEDDEEVFELKKDMYIIFIYFDLFYLVCLYFCSIFYGCIINLDSLVVSRVPFVVGLVAHASLQSSGQ